MAGVRHDFSWFEAPVENPDLEITFSRQRPDYAALPEMLSSVATPRNICYQKDGLSYIDYSGEALNIYDHDRGHCEIHAQQSDLAHEIIYLSILSRVSALLERRGIHRIHGLGLEYAGHGVLLMLPAGGGKTTLALKILESPEMGIRLLSEDSPLIARHGVLLPFPLRLGVHPRALPSGIDQRFTRRISRMEYDPKVTIDIGFFSDRVCHHPVKNRILLAGRRSTGVASSIVPISRAKALENLVMNSVIGVGLYQGMEFLMHRGLAGLFSQYRVLLSRLCRNLRLVAGSRFYQFILGRDVEGNLQTLVAFLKAHLPPQGTTE